MRRKTKIIKIGDLKIGGGNPIAVQSMAKVKTADVKKTLRQINDLKAAGCEIVRLAVKDASDARALKTIKKNSDIPIVADIHFDWRLAIEAINSAVDKIRLNPGNIYKTEEIKAVALAAKSEGIPIRVGINSGSLPRVEENAGSKPLGTIPDRMVKGALNYVRMLESFGFNDIVISLKASNINDTIDAYRKMAKLCDYPFHLGVTATGLPFSGAIKSSIACGCLLSEGIGDTIRISLTDKPEEEIKAARSILKALNLRSFGPEVISCPTCGRCEVNLIKLVGEFEKKLNNTVDCKLLTVNSQPLRVALMGCVVNGPGEAKEADLGIAFGKREGLLFKKGKAVKKVSYDDCINVLLKEITLV